jgi:hypothetical protein
MTSQPTTLAGLPPVLISFIAEALAPEDLACLSLCNHQLSTFLEPQRSHLRSENNDRWLSTEQEQIRMAILHRLERDLPNNFACHICFLLHKYDGSQYYGPCELISPLGDSELLCLASYPEALEVGVETNPRSLFKYHFSFIHVQLAMRRFHYGPSAGISTDSLFTQKSATHTVSRAPWNKSF